MRDVRRAHALAISFGLVLDLDVGGRDYVAATEVGFRLRIYIHLEVELGLRRGGAWNEGQLLLRRKVVLGGHAESLLADWSQVF